MTICIAAVCDGGNAIVVASDRMLSAPFLTLEFDHPDAKIDQITDACVALTSGDALCAQEILLGGSAIAGQLSNPGIQTLADNIRQKFVEIRRRFVEERVLEPRGLNFTDFYQRGLIGQLPPDLAMMLDSQIQSARLDTSILIAGLDGTGAHLFSIEDPGTIACYDRLGYNAIGSGHRHALLTLVAHSQHFSSSLNLTVFNMYCAKRAAELAPGVGTATEMRIITFGGIRTVTGEELSQLEPVYKEKTNPQSAGIIKAIESLSFNGESEDGSSKADGKGNSQERREVGSPG